MFKRMFCYNRFFSALFFLSFVMSFLIIYYGMYINMQILQITDTRLQSVYPYEWKICSAYREEIRSVRDLPASDITAGNIILWGEGPIGDGIVNMDPIDVLWVQNEELRERVNWSPYRLEIGDMEIPKCIIGDAWENEVYIEDGMKYIDICRIKSLVVGVFVPNTSFGMDQRCLVYGDSLSAEEADRILMEPNNLIAKYRSARTDETQKFRDWVFSMAKGDYGNLSEEGRQGLWSDESGMLFLDTSSMYRLIFYMMLTCAALNCAFLAYFWGRMRVNEYLLKRILGFSKRKLFGEIMLQILLYEVISCVTVLTATLLYELIAGETKLWLETIRTGFLLCAGLMIAFGILLSMFPMIWVSRGKLPEILRGNE